MNSYTQKKQTLRQKKEAIRAVLVSTSFRVALGVCVVVFGFMYVWQTNTVSAKGYTMTDLERKINQLDKETRRLDVEIAQHTSISNLESRLIQTNLVVATDVTYMNLTGTAVAKR
ncbi:MAG: hypothetical protein HYV41_04530 [Candidatus Magasanikbacteria bacterium]|nr:hypothetical protein [Candidatus Magasanikbacteria bacterium]